ncbi:hypothetical protein QBC37DRAFT_390448 [Rhypophila decipiens]|uniref:Uncharacterized protein n=1 Tax=Rhypophila decipiens TaxID=261697 RepID=A0AAN6Y361_9PEZI|nr:hypothetical protein QBC37DRAFT_390448 [Rhypophila decipiens]
MNLVQPKMESPQLQSHFVTMLPREIRDLIYLELWRDTGVRQHILWHNDEDRTKSHFCRFPCNTDFTFHDPLQADIEAERTRQGISLGQDLRHRTYTWRLQSPWQSHWACGEAAERIHGMDAIKSCSTSASCFKRKIKHVTVSDARSDGNDMSGGIGASSATMSSGQSATDFSSYLPMLLSCKLISSECLKSIYGSTTFVFTDMVALQFFLGFCSLPHWIRDSWPKIGVPPPGFFSYAARVEISLPACFSYQVYCSADPHATDPLAPPLESAEDVVPFLQESPELQKLHNAYDFHWLRLDE